MDAVSAAIVTKALDALGLRMTATAANIAHGQMAGYRPQRVRFEDSLRAAAAGGAGAVQALTPRVESDARIAAGAEPRLDLELATASDTALRYGALVNLLGREMEIARLGVRGQA
jgi:flagellar basal-body rod protein FlgB